MNPKMIGLAVLTCGIGITGATGAALSVDYRAYLALKGELHFAEALAAESHEEYCENRVAAIGEGLSVEGALADGCEVEGEEEAEENSAEAEAEEDEAKPSEKRVMEIADAVFTADDLSTELSALRSTWIERWAETVPHLQAVEEAAVVAPVDRVKQWFQAQGGLFLLGMVCVVVGSLVSRRAMKAELNDDGGEGEGAVDFGELLDRIVIEAGGIRDQMVALSAPTVADLDALQVRLERLQKEDLERLLSSGPRLQMRLGMGAFAEIFSPLAGGERRLNRLWSTLVDRHWPEAMVSVEVAVAQLESAQSAFRARSTGLETAQSS